MNESPSSAEVRLLLQTIASLLRHLHHLGPDAQLLLADIVDELGKSIEEAAVAPQEMARLADSAAELVKIAQAEDEPGVLQAAQQRMENAAVAVESGSPTLAGLARRLAEMLSNLGI